MKTLQEIIDEQRALSKIHKLTNIEIGYAKTSDALTGITRSTETRKKISDYNKGKKIGKPAWNKGVTPSEETRQKISESSKGVPKPKPSVETRQKMSEERKNRKKIECPHCSMMCDPGNYKRFHGDNCKAK